MLCPRRGGRPSSYKNNPMELTYVFHGILNDPQLGKISEGVRPAAYICLWVQYDFLVAFTLVKEHLMT